jgi:hypothetical protein
MLPAGTAYADNGDPWGYTQGLTASPRRAEKPDFAGLSRSRSHPVFKPSTGWKRTSPAPRKPRSVDEPKRSNSKNLYGRCMDYQLEATKVASKIAEMLILSRLHALERAKGIEPSYAAWEATYENWINLISTQKSTAAVMVAVTLN